MQNVRIAKYTDIYTPRKVLVIGNGFDIAHGLPTSYPDFLRIMKEPEYFLDCYNQMIGKTHIGVIENTDCWDKYLKCITEDDQDDVNKMVTILRDNPWAHYYANCNAEINGWVDFEHEMMPVIDMFNRIISNGSQNVGNGQNNYALVKIEDIGIIRLASLWPKYIKEYSWHGTGNDGVTLKIENHYTDKQYGVIYGKLLDDLKSDLDEFVEGFCLYLNLFTKKIEKRVSWVEKMVVSDIINFNYTGTIYQYDKLREAEISYVHGSLTNSDDTKMIFGVNRVANDAEYRFKDFEKRYLRLCNSTKQLYRKIIAEDNYELEIFGHSLDITDKCILEPLIRGAKKTVIYCYKDINTKKKNLMLMLGDDDTENMLNDDIITLIETGTN